MPGFTQIAAVVGLLGGLVFVAWLVGGKKPVFPFRLPVGARGQRRMTVVERLPLVSQHILHLVEVDGRHLLILTSGATAQVVQGVPGTGQLQRTALPPNGAQQ